MSTLLTGVQVAELFQQTFDAEILKLQNAEDMPALSEMWNNYTDSLCKNGQITQWDYDNIGPVFTKCECCGDICIDLELMEKFDEQREAHERQERTYTFIVDLDERGEYRAHIEDSKGTVVWSIDTEALQQAVEDGFLPCGKDSTTDQWLEYLQETGVEWFDAEDPILVNASGERGKTR